MSAGYYKVNAFGKIIETGMVEGQSLQSDMIPCNSRMVHQISASKGVLTHNGKGIEATCCDPCTLLSMIYNGYDTDEAYRELQNIKYIRNNYSKKHFNKHIDIKYDTTQPTHIFEEVPGLELRPMVIDDIEKAAEIAIRSNIYRDICPNNICDPPEKHAWLRLARRILQPGTWKNTLIYNNKPLQFELIDITNRLATFTLTFHVNRERPGWFWVETEKPIFKRMQEMQIQQIRSHTRKDRLDWQQSLMRNYKATQLGEFDAHRNTLEFPIDMETTIQWPNRKTLGNQWQKIRHTPNNDIKIIEGSIHDFSTIHTLIQNTLPKNRQQYIVDMLDMWYNLDKATLLLFTKNGILEHVRLIRKRNETTASLGMISAFPDIQQNTLEIAPLLNEWCKNVGYTTITAFLPKKYEYRNKFIIDAGYSFVKEHGYFIDPMLEYKKSL